MDIKSVVTMLFNKRNKKGLNMRYTNVSLCGALMYLFGNNLSCRPTAKVPELISKRDENMKK